MTNPIKIAAFKVKNSSFPLESQKNNGEGGILAYYIIGAVLLIIGVIPWFILENDKWEYEKKKMKKEHKNIPCQSCGMNLASDFKPHMDFELCSHCFNGTNYIEPELTSKQMSERISLKMKEQNINQKKIDKHIEDINKLRRWDETLKW